MTSAVTLATVFVDNTPRPVRLRFGKLRRNKMATWAVPGESKMKWLSIIFIAAGAVLKHRRHYDCRG
jgi:hypothetical protein